MDSVFSYSFFALRRWTSLITNLMRLIWEDLKALISEKGHFLIGHWRTISESERRCTVSGGRLWQVPLSRYGNWGLDFPCVPVEWQGNPNAWTWAVAAGQVPSLVGQEAVFRRPPPGVWKNPDSSPWSSLVLPRQPHSAPIWVGEQLFKIISKRLHTYTYSPSELFVFYSGHHKWLSGWIETWTNQISSPGGSKETRFTELAGSTAENRADGDPHMGVGWPWQGKY